MVLTFVAPRRLVRFSLVCALTVGIALLSKEIHLSSLITLRSFFLKVVRSCGWTSPLQTALGEMGSQGTATRLLSIATQVSLVRASLTKVHQGTPDVSVLLATAADLQRQLEEGTITSESLVLKYVDQIEKHNLNGQSLHAMTSIASKDKLVDFARNLDAERRSKGPRSPLHGIPIVAKVRIHADSTGYYYRA
jgi:hypothetical protein